MKAICSGVSPNSRSISLPDSGAGFSGRTPLLPQMKRNGTSGK